MELKSAAPFLALPREHSFACVTPTTKWIFLNLMFVWRCITDTIVLTTKEKQQWQFTNKLLLLYLVGCYAIEPHEYAKREPIMHRRHFLRDPWAACDPTFLLFSSRNEQWQLFISAKPFPRLRDHAFSVSSSVAVYELLMLSDC